MALCGFTLFLTSNALTLWGSLPLSDLTGLSMLEILWYWSTPQVMSLGVTFLMVLLARHLKRTSIAVCASMLAGGISAAGYLILLAMGNGAMFDNRLITVVAMLFGVGNGGFYILWAYCFSSFDEHEVMKVVLAALAIFPLVMFLLYVLAIPALARGTVAVCLSTALLVACLVGKPLGQMDGIDGERVSRRAMPQYREAFRTMRGSLLCVAAIGFVVAITRTLALSRSASTDLVGIVALAGVSVAAILLAVVWFTLKHPFSLSAFYRVVFPVIATTLLALPFLSDRWAMLISALVYLVFSIVSSLIMFSGIQIAHRTDTDPLLMFGILAGVMYVSLGIGTVVGASQYADTGTTGVALVALLSVYFLSMGVIAMQNKRLNGEVDMGDDAKLVAMDELATGADAPLLLQRCTQLAHRYELSAREVDVLELLVRGRDVPYIAKSLFISENTVRYHSKNIYRKLDVHNKQELLTLFEGARERNT